MFDLGRFSDRTAVICDDGTSVSYSDLQGFADAIAAAVPPRSLILCLCTNDIPSVAGYIACIQSKLPVILMDGTKDASAIGRMLEAYVPEYIWAPGDNPVIEPGSALIRYGGHMLCPFSGKAESSPIHEDLALCLSTSGTTGSPKLVRLTENNLLSNALSIIEYLGITEHERPLLSLPLHYSYGLSVLNTHLLAGATILLTDKSVGQMELWYFLKEQRATSFSGVPYTYEMLLRFRLLRMELPYLKTFTQAGGRLSEGMVLQMAAYAASHGKRFFVMYGQTEAAPRMSYLPAEFASEKPGSIGVAVPGGCICIMDGLTELNGDGVCGELVYSGPNVCMGYAENRSDLSFGDLNHGCLRTGDIARKDKDGFFYIMGRLKRFVKLWGNRCNLDELEVLARQMTPDCACVGIDDLVTIFITDESLSESVIEHVSAHTGINEKAFRTMVLPVIPRNASGKIMYDRLISQQDESGAS